MTTTWCPELSADPAVMFAADAHSRFMGLGKSTYDLAMAHLTELGDIALEPVAFDASFDYQGPDPTNVFRRPTRPNFDLSDIKFNAPDIPALPPSFSPNPIQVDPVPEIDADAPVLSFGVKPNLPSVVEPTKPQLDDNLDVPLPPNYVLPAVPSFVQLNMPSAPDIVIDDFTEDRPVFIEPPFNNDWTFVPEAYTSVLKDQLIGEVQRMLAGQEALPAPIERAIFERMRGRNDIEARRALDTASAEFASRGFNEPPGILSDRVSEIVQANQSANASASRDAAIKQYEESLANLRLALQQGAALEGVYIGLHVEMQRFALQAAQAQREADIAVLNARISVFNARLEAFRTDAAVFRDRVQAKLAQIEIFKAQIEAERAKGEINDQKVRVYESQLRGLQAMAEFYRTQVEGVKTRADMNRAKIEGYKAELDAYGERWRAYAVEWQGFSANAEAEGKRADVFKSLVEANGQRVSAWSTSQNTKMDVEKLRMAQYGVDLDAWKAGLALTATNIDAERARLSAATSLAEAETRIYAADAEVERTLTESLSQAVRIGLEMAKTKVDTNMAVANAKVSQATNLVNQQISIRDSIAKIAAQLSAATMSAMSYSAGVSSGRSRSNSCSTNYSFNGEIADA